MNKKIIIFALSLIIICVSISGCSGTSYNEEVTSSMESTSIEMTDDPSSTNETVLSTDTTHTTAIPETDAIVSYTAENTTKGFWARTYQKINKPDYKIESSISYSYDGGQTYGNQKKEFPTSQKIYVRISTKVISDSSGKDERINTTFLFSGTEKYSVQIADGNAQRVKSAKNTLKYSMDIISDTEKNAKEYITIFQYSPLDEGSAKLEVSFDDNIEPKYDLSSKIYFINNNNLY